MRRRAAPAAPPTDGGTPGAPVVRGVVDLRLLDGSGGSSSVWVGRQEAVDQTVAVKVMTVGLTDPASVARFTREARAVGPLSWHPNVITVLDAERTPDARPYLIMQYVAGGSLAARLAQRGPLPVPEVLRVGIRIAGALDAAHGLPRPLVHRDVKPQNILLGAGDDPVLADFGVAVLAEQAELVTSTAYTAVHAPPEVLDGGPPTTAGDVYSLCSTLHELLAGTPAFPALAGEAPVAHARRVLSDPVPVLLRPDVPPLLARVLAAGMDKEPRNRPDAEQLAGALQGVERQLGLPVTVPLLRREGVGHLVPHAAPPAGLGLAAPAPVTQLSGGIGPAGPAATPVPGGRSRTPLVAAGAGVVVLLVAVGALLLTRGGSTPAPAPVSAPTPGTPTSVSTSPLVTAMVARPDPTTLRVSWTTMPASAPVIGFSVVWQGDDSGTDIVAAGPGATTVDITVAAKRNVLCAVVTRLLQGPAGPTKEISPRVCTA